MIRNFFLFAGLIVILFSFACDNGVEIPGLSKRDSVSSGLILRLRNRDREPNLDSYNATCLGVLEADEKRFLWVSADDGNNEELQKQLATDESLLYVEPNYRAKLFTGGGVTPYVPNDPWWGGVNNGVQYGKSLCNQESAYNKYGIGSNYVIAATIDSGLNFLHEEFAGSLADKTLYGWSSFEQVVGVDGDISYTAEDLGDTGSVIVPVGGENYTIKIFYSMIDPANQTNWDGGSTEGHGSHVAGIIGAKGNNSKGIVGGCPEKLSFVMYKLFASGVRDPDSGEVYYSLMGGSDFSIYSSLVHLVSQRDSGVLKYGDGVDGVANTVVPSSALIPVNMSFGGGTPSYFQNEMIAFAIAKNILPIASSGNDSLVMENYPAALSGVISVGAVDSRGQKANFTTGSKSLSVVAPGEDVYSVGGWTNNAYLHMSGTSMSAPYVTGLVAYLLTFDNTLTIGQLRTLIESSATDLGATGHDPWYGHGLVNVEKAVEVLLSRKTAGMSTLPSNYLESPVSVTVNTVSGTNYPSFLYLYRDGIYYSMAVREIKEGVTTSVASFSLLPEGDYRVDYNGANRTFKVVKSGEALVLTDSGNLTF